MVQRVEVDRHLADALRRRRVWRQLLLLDVGGILVEIHIQIAMPHMSLLSQLLQPPQDILVGGFTAHAGVPGRLQLIVLEVAGVTGGHVRRFVAHGLRHLVLLHFVLE